MKRKFVLIILASVTMIALMTAASIHREGLKQVQNVNKVIGTWKLELYKYGSSTSEFTARPAGIPRIKLITDTHFTWVTTDTIKKRVAEAAGGRYTLKENEYTEYIDYGLGMDSYLGTSNTYTVKVDGNMLFLSGKLEGYGKIEEIWQRIK